MKKLFQKERCFHLCDRRLDEILLHRFQPDANFLIEKSLISAKRNIFTMYFTKKDYNTKEKTKNLHKFVKSCYT